MSLAAFFAFVSAACAAALAAAAAARARRSRSRWAFAAGMAVLAAESIFVGLGVSASVPADLRRWQEWRLIALSWVPLAWLLFSVSYARGDNRTLPSRDLVPLLLAALLPFGHLLFRADAFADAGPDTMRLGWAGMILCAFVLMASVLTVMNLERTFRAAIGTMRWRIKFMLLGVGVLLVARIYTTSQILVFHGLDASFDSINSAALIVASPLILRSFFRAGHFDLDVYPSQSVLQNSVTVLIAGIYLVIIGALANAVARFGGDSTFALQAFIILVSLVALAVLLQSDHARLRLRKFVSRHFKRPSYDYRMVWQKFAAATTSRLEPAELSRSLVAFVADVFASLSVSMWVVNEKKDALILVASTSAEATPVRGTAARTIDAAGAIAHLRTHPAPADIETLSAAWAALLREAHPRQFPHGGHRVCVPLASRDDLLGVMLIGDRVGGAPLDLQDFEMLKCIGDHAAASFMNVQLSQSLLQAREFQAFQAMATFFVHDLKNAASTLNLMLQNLPVHFDNPEFRADALRGVTKTVTHINRLIGGLSELRHELKVEPAPASLNELVDQTLAGLNHSPGAAVEKDLRPLPQVALDRDQFHKVIINLVLNATEAVSPGGRVHISTVRENGWAVLVVEDNGCGMSESFLRESLFRPFQTTKRNGLGIGMFQSKMIVEAHGGQLTVTSQPGRGTTFRVRLPCPATIPADYGNATRVEANVSPRITLPHYETQPAHH